MKRVLIANRGEIALRLVRAFRDMSIETAAVYSSADKDSLHVREADFSICIGPSAAKDSYLNIGRIIAACEALKCDAVHPGYGFLSENSLFAKIVEENGLQFIGPSSELIALLGDKIAAKKMAERANCPIIPGSKGKISSVVEGIEIAREIGFPVLIKAAAGGGGKGIRIVEREEDFKKAYLQAKEEALFCYGDDTIYLEKRIEEPKHVEVQIVADTYGNTIHVMERDCTLQRRRQKLIEETPSPSLRPFLREEICGAAVRLMKLAGYFSLGTVEFLVDKYGKFYFMEVNTRVQVEHTITEELTGIDLVELQIRIARGEKLPLAQNEIASNGHVMEFRINAEDPSLDFRPSPGLISKVVFPLGRDVRIDTGVYSGYRISPYYDSMIAKLIVKGRNREEVIQKSRRMLEEFQIEGIQTTIPFFQQILTDRLFVNNEHTIMSIDEPKKEEVCT